MSAFFVSASPRSAFVLIVSDGIALNHLHLAFENDEQRILTTKRTSDSTNAILFGSEDKNLVCHVRIFNLALQRR